MASECISETLAKVHVTESRSRGPLTSVHVVEPLSGSNDTAAVRVVMVLATSRRRGAEIEGHQLASRLATAGHEVTTVALRPVKGAASIDGVEVLGVTSLGLGVLAHLRRLARQADVVIAYGSRTLPACAISLAGLHVPFIYRSIGDPAQWAGGRARQWRTGILLRRAAAVVSLWNGSAESIARLYRVPDRRIHVIHNARDSTWFRPPTDGERQVARLALGATPNDTVVAIVGALEPEKDPARALRSSLRVDRVRVLVAGDGRLRAALMSTFSDSRVAWLGSVEDVRPVLWAADVLLSTSRTEGLPGTLIESIMCGTPVVTTNVGAIADGVFEGVSTVALSPSERDVADALGRRHLDAVAAATWSRAFDWSKVVSQWVTVIRTVHQSTST